MNTSKHNHIEENRLFLSTVVGDLRILSGTTGRQFDAEDKDMSIHKKKQQPLLVKI